MTGKKIINKAEAGFYALFLCYAILQSNSRGAFLAMMIILMLIFISNFSVKNLLLSILILIALSGKFYGTALERYESIMADAEEGTGTGGQRLGAWMTGARMIVDNPLLGVGVGQFPHRFLDYATKEALSKVSGGREAKVNAHSAYFQIGAETGMIGLTLFFVMLFFCYKDVAKALKLCRGDPGLADFELIVRAVGISIIGYLTALTFLNQGYNVTIYTLLSLPTIVVRIAEKAKSSEDNEKNEETLLIANIKEWQQIIIRGMLFTLSFFYVRG